MYASHRDACILGYYAWLVNQRLEEVYKTSGINENVIAYRRLGKANYHFSAEALTFALAVAPCKILAFDVTSFFDKLDHSHLKRRLRSLLGVSELSRDWYAVFRHVTRYRKVALDDLRAHALFGPRLTGRQNEPIATVAELKAAGIPILCNPNKYGIPQGTPISSSFANLYMLDFDRILAAFCAERGAFYRRYSDDILLICKEADALEAEKFVQTVIASERLEIQDAKTERTLFTSKSSESAQYLGFALNPLGATIRPSSLSRQWRKLRRATRRVRKAGMEAIAEGRATKIYTRKLRKRFSPLTGRVRNFASYARRSAEVMGDKGIMRQARRLERELEAIIAGFKDHEKPGTPPVS